MVGKEQKPRDPGFQVRRPNHKGTLPPSILERQIFKTHVSDWENEIRNVKKAVLLRHTPSLYQTSTWGRRVVVGIHGRRVCFLTSSSTAMRE